MYIQYCILEDQSDRWKVWRHEVDWCRMHLITLCMLSVCWRLGHSFARLWPTGWSDSIHTLCENLSSIFCIELFHLGKLWPIQPPYLHTYTMQHINYISANLWATGWSNSMHTLCKNSGGASCIDLLHLCKVWPIQPLPSICKPWSMSNISLPSCGPPAGLTVYLHCVRCHEVYPVFMHCMSAKLQPNQLLCQVYTMQHINYISANLCTTGWSKSIHTLCKNSGSASCNDLFCLCKVWPL